MKRRLADATNLDRVPLVDHQFVEAMRALGGPPPEKRSLGEPLRACPTLTGEGALAIFRSQLESRHIDFCSRALKKTGDSFYTIGSAGHEGNAAVAAALRPTDPALLHYRSGGFFLHRARQAGYEFGPRDVLRGVAAAASEPIAGGRHKVFGSLPLAIPPQTSTIASHLPKSVGMGFSLERANRLKLDVNCPRDSIIACTFGDASANHSTATGAINAALWATHQGQGVPVLFVCEDNGLGISVPTPKDWIVAAYGSRPHLGYFSADGLDLSHAYEIATSAADYVRTERRPAFLHLRTVRMLGHAGSDIESVYRSARQIEDTESRDPLIRSAALLIEEGMLTAQECLALYEDTRSRIAALGKDASAEPKITSLAQVMEPLAPRDDEAIAEAVNVAIDPSSRAAFWRGRLPEEERPAPLGLQLNRALGDLLQQYPQALIFGEDVAQKGGVYGVTKQLARKVKRGRVFDTLLDEQTILGIAIGAAQLGLLPLPEIQYLAYLHNAEDQLRGEAASLQFFSQAQFQNPMVVRIASYAYQKGFGGHFHNDNSVAMLRDIPGIVIASPARADDAVAMLRTCVASAKTCGTVSAFLEPIALYPVRDLHEKGDGAWCTPYAIDGPHVPIGEGKLHQDGDDILIVSWANGLWMSLRAAKRLERRNIKAAVFDLRWLAPLPERQLVELAKRVGKVLIVDETRRSGGVSEGVMATLVDGGFRGPMARVTGADTFVPLGDAANLVLVQEDDIEAAAEALHHTN